MRNKPKIFICLDEALIVELIGRAERTIVFAAPSISCEIANTIVDRKKSNPNIRIDVVLDPNARSLRLGFGEIGGLKALKENRVDVRCTSELRIGALIVDKRSWIFAPTPEIILDRANGGTYNAININRNMTEWLLYAVAPEKILSDMAREEITQDYGPLPYSDSNAGGPSSGEDNILDEEIIAKEDQITSDATDLLAEQVGPEIGTSTLSCEDLWELTDEIERNPPKQFDHERELLVYSSYLQFVDLKFTGGRLNARTLNLKSGELPHIFDDVDARVEISAACRLFENIENTCPEIRSYEGAVSEFRRKFTRRLSDDLGSVILSRERQTFDEGLRELQTKLKAVKTSSKEKLAEAISDSKCRLLEILMPLVMKGTPESFETGHSGYSCEFTDMFLTLERTLSEHLPDPKQLIEGMKLICSFKDVTWEMLNEPKFGDAIKKRFPGEKFTRLFNDTKAISERSKQEERIISNEDWPEEINDKPFGS